MPDKKTIRVFIVEDEAISRASLESVLEINGYEVVGSVAKAELAFELIPAQKPDVVLLDLNLAGAKDGIWLAQELKTILSLPIIFITAFSDKKTLEIIKSTRPSGYLKKPYEDSTLLTTIDIAVENLKDNTSDVGTILSDIPDLFLKSGGKKTKINPKDIIYLKSDGNYLNVILTHSALFVRGKLETLLASLPPDLFVQIHRRYAVNVNFVQAFEKNTVIVNSMAFSVSRSFEPVFRARFSKMHHLKLL